MSRTAVENPAGACEAASITASPRQAGASVLDSELLQLGALAALYALPAVWFIHGFYLSDPDIWWHLRTGQWILQHHSIPFTDPFSAYGMGKPWTAYSWIFDTLIALAYGRFGLMGIDLYDIAVRLALPVALFHLVRGLLPRFWRAAALTGAGLFVVLDVAGPRPGMLTILFVILELDILLRAKKAGRGTTLWLLPPMLALWANWHIQFVYGLFVLGVFACEPFLERIIRAAFLGREAKRSEGLPEWQVWLALAASALATLLNPYGARVYSTVFQYMGQHKVFSNIVELQAMTFREPQHFAALLLLLAAAAAIGWRRNARPLWWILLAAGGAMGFRSVKDVWFAAVLAVCAIADGWTWEDHKGTRVRSSVQRAAVCIWALAMVVLACRRYDLSNSALELQVAGNFPEGAARYVEQHHLRGPLYNHFDWGGFLIWRLPQLPVAIDGRTNVQGDDRVLRFAEVWSGKPVWANDPDLAQANLVIAKRDAALTSLLREDARFEIAYEDGQAVVFQRR